MRTVLFVYADNSERYEALLKQKEQSLDFMRSYKVKKRRKLCII